LCEALYALDLIASDLLPEYGQRPLFAKMEALMLMQPGNWNRHYDGDDVEKRLLRHYSLSDRIRYYWASPDAKASLDRLLSILRGKSVPWTLVAQHLPEARHFADSPLDPEEVLIWRVTRSISAYHAACGWSE
jgi:tagatose-1,6-bisphosphate aldolase non-catalytic subunit AgaZ/GatZ